MEQDIFVEVMRRLSKIIWDTTHFPFYFNQKVQKSGEKSIPL